jgi:TetR/AcrR family transcriptional regulator, cholesterol catabolism regulator
MGRPKKVIFSAGGDDPPDFETRTRILEAAKELFKARGFKGVSMKEVAEAVSITPAALYYYFPDGKETLFLAVLNNILDDRAQGMARAVSNSTTLRDKLYQLTLFFLTGANDAVPILMRDVAAQVKDEQKRGEVWHRFGGDYIAVVTKVFQEAVESGELAAGISFNLVATLFNGMNFSLWHNPHVHALLHDQAAVENLARAVVSILLDGVHGMDTSLVHF